MNTEYTQDDVEEMAELTGRVATNLKAIEESSVNEDQLEELDQQTGRICANLKEIEDSQYSDDDYLATLEAQLDRILAKMKTIEDADESREEEPSWPVSREDSSIVKNMLKRAAKEERIADSRLEEERRSIEKHFGSRK